MTRFLVVPQWQGSPAARAMHLVDGAEAIAGDLPRARTTRIEVPSSAGESLDTGVRRFSALSRVQEAITDALGAPPAADGSSPPAPAEPVVVIGGDCGVAVPAIAAAASRHDDLAVIWFDAHADLHSPETSPSGAFAGMALRAAFDEMPLPGSGAVDASRVVLAGAREVDPEEREPAARLTVLSVDDLRDPDALSAAVAATGASAVFIHVDLDVLDPAVITGVGLPVPFGLQLSELIAAIAAVRAQATLVGASLAGFAPATPAAAVDDLGTILRVVGALA